TVSEAPDIAEFLADFAAMFAFGGRIKQRECASIIYDRGRIVLVQLIELAKLFSSRGVWRELITTFGVFAGGSFVLKLCFKARADEQQGRFIALLFIGPLLGRDARRFFVLAGIFDIRDDARGIVYGASKGGLVASFFEELNGEQGD